MLADVTGKLVDQMWTGLGGRPDLLELARTERSGGLAAPYAVTDLGVASVLTAGLAIVELMSAANLPTREVQVDRATTSAWLTGWEHHLAPEGRTARWHDMSSDFPTADGRWLRVQANFTNLRDAVCKVLQVEADASAIAAAVRTWNADEVEAALIDGGAAVAASRTVEEWARHPQGIAVAQESLVDRSEGGARVGSWAPTDGRPLAGIRVLDCTRVVAGPVGTRFLAGYGAEVLRIDPPGYIDIDPRGRTGGDWTVGKRCAELNLRTDEGRERMLELLAGADIFVHGYRPGALEALGLDRAVREQASPGLIEVSLNAYGWTGPWKDRRGFDSLVQASTGISTAMMEWLGGDRPAMLPSQINDHATGYLIAAAAIRGLTERLGNARGSEWALALARTAKMLIDGGQPTDEEDIETPLRGPYDGLIYASPSGLIRRLVPPLAIPGNPYFWDRAGESYGSATAQWSTQLAPYRR